MNLSKLKETNTYIIIYATVMVIIVAYMFLLIKTIFMLHFKYLQ